MTIRQLELTFLHCDAHHPEFVRLVQLLDEDLRIRDGVEHAFFAQFNRVDHIRNVVLVFYEGEAIACGAFKHYEEKVAELKRMFVVPQYRSMGIASFVLQELEHWAAAEAYQKLILETGIQQPEAIRLYQKNNYQLIPNFGQYEGVLSSRCYEKDLV